MIAIKLGLTWDGHGDFKFLITINDFIQIKINLTINKWIKQIITI
jgi:hypothetical protein